LPAPKLLVNRWILSRLGVAVTASTVGIRAFRLDDASGALYHFFWSELCDWYLELTKPIFASGTDEEKAETRATLAHAIETALRALHPFVPFVTEELWQRVPRPSSRPKTIALAPYPTARDGAHDPDAERELACVMDVITAARTIRSEHEVHPGAKVPLRLRSADAEKRALLANAARFVAALVKTDGDPMVEAPGERPRGFVVSVVSDVDVLVGLKGLVEGPKEAERIERTLKKIEKDLVSLDKRLGDSKFLANAPAEVVTQVREQKAELERKRVRLAEERGLVGELDG
jgi:valyl-tRNA synthetase